MQKKNNEIKQKDGKEVIDKTKKDYEEQLLKKYNSTLGSFQKETGTIFIDKKKEIEGEIDNKLGYAEKEEDSIIEKAKVKFPGAYEFIKKNVYKNL